MAREHVRRKDFLGHFSSRFSTSTIGMELCERTSKKRFQRKVCQLECNQAKIGPVTPNSARESKR